MDVNSLICNGQHRKRRKRERKDNKGRISICDLPDEVLDLIISSLPTIDAVRTSVLSKRWEHLWKNVSKIELEEERRDKRQQFIDFVRRLPMVCNCSNFKKFSLSCNVVTEDFSHVNMWLHRFINPKIEELNLDIIGLSKPLVFPDYLFTSTTLTKFQLAVAGIFKLPSSIHFNCLKALTLRYVTFPDDSSTKKLFSGCPSLEELDLFFCYWWNVESVCISSPLLQKLEIHEDYFHGKVSRCKIEIMGTKLRTFTYYGDCKDDYFFHHPPMAVIDASIEVCTQRAIHEEDWHIHAGYFVIGLLEELSNVEKLSISDSSLPLLSDLELDLPVFSNLAELHVLRTQCPQTDLLFCPALMTLLRNSPCLQVAELGPVTLSTDDGVKKNNILDPIPACFRTHLKMIKICYWGGEEDLHAIQFLLQEASVLDKLYIGCAPAAFLSPMGSRSLEKLRKQIERFPKGSMNCEIDLEQW